MSQNDLLHSPQAEALFKNKDKVMGMANSPEAQQLMALLRQAGGKQLDGATQAAMKGDPQQLIQLVQRVMSTSEGAGAINSINRKLQK